LAGGVGVCQNLGVDVDHELVALSGGAGIELVMQRHLGEQRQSVSLLLLHRRRVHLRSLIASSLTQGLASRGQGLHEQRADLGSQPSADSHRTVFIWIHVQRAGSMLQRGLPGLGLAIHAPHDPLDVLGGAGPADCQEEFLGLGPGNPRELPDLGIGQLAASERLRQLR
jgi:hypothetical protein